MSIEREIWVSPLQQGTKPIYIRKGIQKTPELIEYGYQGVQNTGKFILDHGSEITCAGGIALSIAATGDLFYERSIPDSPKDSVAVQKTVNKNSQVTSGETKLNETYHEDENTKFTIEGDPQGFEFQN